MNFNANNLAVVLEGKAGDNDPNDETDVTVSGFLNNTTFSLQMGNFKKVQTLRIDSDVLQFLFRAYNDFNGMNE